MNDVRFADGLRYRIEIPSVEGPAVLRAVIEDDGVVVVPHWLAEGVVAKAEEKAARRARFVCCP